jgi:serine/threonine protein phosphatase 1
MWVRAEFVRNPHNLGKTVVFGHTPFDDVLLDLPYKIGIDTGVVYGNRLSAVELVQGSLFQVERGDTEVRISSLRDRLDSRSD